MPIGIEKLAPAEALARLDELSAVYQSVFAEPPWNERDRGRFAAQLSEHVRWPGWRGLVAEDGGGNACALAYGAVPAFPFPGTGAYGRVERLLGHRVAALGDLFEVLEIAVAPEARGQGLARQMLDELVADVNDAWRLTVTAASGAVALYERSGWELQGVESDRDGDTLRIFRWSTTRDSGR